MEAKGRGRGKATSGIKNWGAEWGRGRLGQSIMTCVSENITKILLCILTLKLFFKDSLLWQREETEKSLYAGNLACEQVYL